jgi:hypothetical protein
MTGKPDIRVHSVGAANAYGFRPLSEAGSAFVNGHAAMVPGKWQDGIFWFNDRFMPRAALNASPLNIVAGIGDTDEHDRPWPRDPVY